MHISKSHPRLQRYPLSSIDSYARGLQDVSQGEDGACFIAKGNALVHFGAPAGHTNSSCAAQAAAKLSVLSARYLG